LHLCYLLVPSTAIATFPTLAGVEINMLPQLFGQSCWGRERKRELSSQRFWGMPGMAIACSNVVRRHFFNWNFRPILAQSFCPYVIIHERLKEGAVDGIMALPVSQKSVFQSDFDIWALNRPEGEWWITTTQKFNIDCQHYVPVFFFFLLLAFQGPMHETYDTSYTEA
jgi:hypothetical protein